MRTKNEFLFNAVALLSYSCLIISGLYHHELWGDEIHSWNIVKGSHSLGDLFSNIRYEGHPPFWYLCLFFITQFSHSLFYLKAAQFVFVFLTACLILFYSPFNRIQKVMLLCGYYFIFEYAMLARNYMPAVFFACGIAAIFKREFTYQVVCYYLLLLLLSNVHLLGILLSAAIHAGFCFDRFQAKKGYSIHILSGILILLPSLYFILPPADSQLNFQFWKEQWSPDRLFSFVAVVVRSLFPWMDIGNPHWWNTNLLLDLHSTFLRITAGTLSVFLLVVMCAGLKKSKTAFVILLVNLVLTFILSIVFPLNTARYTGFVFIGFIVAAWISFYRTDRPVNNSALLLVLFLQLPGGFYAPVKDYRNEFSSAERVTEMQKQIPQNAFVATDYWCLNNLSAFLDSAFYCIELDRPVSFLVWNSEMKSVIRYDYGQGLKSLLVKNQYRPFYFYSSHSREQYSGSAPAEGYQLELVSRSGPAIERSGEVYLYKVQPF